MKTKLNLFQTGLLGVVALGSATCFSVAAATADAADSAPAKTSIPWSQLGAKAGAEYQGLPRERAHTTSSAGVQVSNLSRGDGLSVSATPEGARLRCVFQRLEGEATRKGLWLTSTVTNAVADRFRVVAAAVGRSGNEWSAAGCEAPAAAASSVLARCGWIFDHSRAPLPRTGTVSVEDKLVRFTRPGLVEQYRLSMDGVRQDFIIEHPPFNPQLSALNQRAGDLVVRLAVSGARVEPAAIGWRPVGAGELRAEDCLQPVARHRCDGERVAGTHRGGVGI